MENDDIYWEVSELIGDNLFYKFGDGDHGHSFDAVLHKIVENPECDTIEGDRTQYSVQELRIIDKLKAKAKEQLTAIRTLSDSGAGIATPIMEEGI